MSIDKLLQERANSVLVGGVSSGWNSFPNFDVKHFKQSDGAYIYDVDGQKYIDYCMGWGSLFLGHKPDIIQNAFNEAFNIGFGFQYETEYHVKLAELITELVPCGEKVRFANSGTEATMFAIRMARTKTGRKKIIKFEGHFHGVHDYLLFAMDASDRLGKKMLSGEIEPISGSSGIPSDINELVIPVPFNDIEAFQNVIDKYGDDIAGVILEPILLSSAVIFPNIDYLKAIRNICTQKGIVLIFDEVMSGFRGEIAGAQNYLGVTPDLATFGKILGGGLPIAAIVGKSEFMDVLRPIGNAEASGTNTGRVYAMVGAYHVLNHLRNNPHLYSEAHHLNDLFCNGVKEIFSHHGVPGFANGYAGRIVIHIGTNEPCNNFRDVVNTWNKTYHLKCYEQAYNKKLYAFLLPLLVCPEPITITPIHTREDINETLNILESIIRNTPYIQ
ncbi:aspartate aminotransferase family protein [Paenibacillus humicus]|uniref:aspartate aminotransferase family protein n=1 Tax=Paenibacillus humicus TaxID=412861 RepID=UPI003D2D54E5